MPGRVWRICAASSGAWPGVRCGVSSFMMRSPVGITQQPLERRARLLALRFIKVAAAEIERNNVSDGVVALVDRKCRLHAGLDAGAIAVAAGENLALEQDDRLAQPMRPNVGDEFVEASGVEQRQLGCERMKFEIPLRGLVV